MLIEELLGRGGDSPIGVVARSLYSFAQTAAQNARQHAKRILAQLPEFDLHDEVHLKAVLTNMEQICGPDNLSRLSVYELFFLYTASQLHDVGMALPDWELKAIEAVEAENNLKDESWRKDFNTKGNGPLSITNARLLIVKHAAELYNDYRSVGEWFFAPPSEEHLRDYLARTVVDYQTFRSGYSKKLSTFENEALSRYVQSLRIEFIRGTHHKRSHFYVKGLSQKMPEGIPAAWRESLARDLADICQAHGEPLSYLDNLKTEAQYLGADTANLQFVASLLRVADIVHFSLDRAPLVLSSEMQFVSEESFVHWAMKQQGVNYEICESGNAGKKTIRFKAYCTIPRCYYELHKYLDWVDGELANFAKVSRRWELNYGKPTSLRWSIPLVDEVDRSGIEYDSERFEPVRGLSFSLEQRRILELLMGVRLYKDEYASLRELYQNSLDACKCMIALSNGATKGKVEFWLDRKNGGRDVYLCCLDNGVGMTREIIERHLLRVGNSYYTSPAFERLRASHQHRFTPTSQFGIGILSCFMLGDSLDIVTKPMQEISPDTSAIRCTIDGLHEDFYYSLPDPADLDMIGKHGTIVRIRLHSADAISDFNDSKLWFRYFARRKTRRFEAENEALFASWDNHLHHIVTRFVPLPHKDIVVNVRLANGTQEAIVRGDRAFRAQDFAIDAADLLRLEEFSRNDGWGDGREDEDAPSHSRTYECSIEHNGIEYSWLLHLPTSADDSFAARPFCRGGLSIDGISVTNNGVSHDDVLGWFCDNGHLNFTGDNRPVLSVDRNMVTTWPESITADSSVLLKKVLETTVAITAQHIEGEGFGSDDPLLNSAWDQLFDRFSICEGELLTVLSSHERYWSVVPRDVGKLTENRRLTLREFLEATEMRFPHVRYGDLGRSAQLLFLGKCGNAVRLGVDDNGVYVEGHGLSPLVTTYPSIRSWRFTEIVLKCDEWSGRFSEYDLVTEYWPVIPARLFDRLQNCARGQINSERAIELHRMGNGISAVAEQDPCLVEPHNGLYCDETSRRRGTKERCKVGRFERPSADHWQFEINNHYETDEPVRYILFAYVSPRPLTDEEKDRLKDFEDHYSEYVRGVCEGWSLLFLGRKHTPPIILPGIVSRNTIANAINDEIFAKVAGDNLSFLDGTPLAEVRNANGSTASGGIA